MIGALLLASGLAQGATVSGFVAPTVGVSDPFIRRRGLQLGVDYAFAPVFALSGTFAFYPKLGEADHRAVTRQLINENNIAPDISRLVGTGALRMAFYPCEGEAGRFRIRLGAHGGVGLAWTVDDLEALQADPGDPAYANTERQRHGAMGWGLVGDAFAGRVGLHMGLDRLSYVETIGSTTLEMKKETFIVLGLALRSSPDETPVTYPR